MAYTDPERRRAYGREWMKRNPEKAREAMRRWRKAHPDKRNANRRLYYARHREEVLVRDAQYQREHPWVGIARWQNYRARKRAALGSFTSAEWRALVAEHEGRCAYCGEQRPLEPDHRVPLARGGTNAIENILPACRRCNAKKHLLSEAEFRARLAREGRGDLQL